MADGKRIVPALHQPDLPLDRPQGQGVVPQDWHQHREAHPVHAGGDEQDQQLAHRAITVSTSAISRGARESHSAPPEVTR